MVLVFRRDLEPWTLEGGGSDKLCVRREEGERKRKRYIEREREIEKEKEKREREREREGEKMEHKERNGVR